MSYVLPQKVLFRHCDPAGIVFYPRYFEMMNDCVEAFFEEALNLPFADIHTHGAVPTVALSIQFKAVSRLGDQLAIHLKCVKLGRTSLSLETNALCGEELRFTATSTLVFVDTQGKPTPWPATARRKLELFVKESSL